jgi:hypothetical protein
MVVDPERLKASDATKLVRRMLRAAGDERPSPELTNRMRRAVGLSISGASAPALAATRAAGLAWISAGIVTAAIVGGAVGTWTSTRRSVSPTAPPAAAVQCAGRSTQIATPIASPIAAAPLSDPLSGVGSELAGRSRKRLAVTAPAKPATGDLRDEIALVDEARTALREESPRRALTALRRYAASYPGGTFAPEAEALRIEALNDSGQHRLAQSLAHDFVNRHPAHPLAERIGRTIDDRSDDPP